MFKRFIVFTGQRYDLAQGAESCIGSARTIEECRSILAVHWAADSDGHLRWAQILDQHLRRAFFWDNWTKVGVSGWDSVKIFPKDA